MALLSSQSYIYNNMTQTFRKLTIVIVLLLFFAIHLYSQNNQRTDYFKQGDYALSEGRYLDAVIYLMLSINERPNSARYINCAIANRNLGLYANAVYYMEKAVEYRPDMHYTYLNRGTLLGEWAMSI